MSRGYFLNRISWLENSRKGRLIRFCLICKGDVSSISWFIEQDYLIVHVLYERRCDTVNKNYIVWHVLWIFFHERYIYSQSHVWISTFYKALFSYRPKPSTNPSLILNYLFFKTDIILSSLVLLLHLCPGNINSGIL